MRQLILSRPTYIWLFRAFGDLSPCLGGKQPEAKQIKLGSAIRLAFEQFEPVGLSSSVCKWHSVDLLGREASRETDRELVVQRSLDL